jgi:hypothetical protein
MKVAHPYYHHDYLLKRDDGYGIIGWICLAQLLFIGEQVFICLK